MPEYLSPGVYVEEFDSGSKAMEGVGTSTAGFVGAAERGPVGGVPQLVTNPADFRRKFGGYLSESAFGNKRFLAYAVEHFFMNGGSRCFISRVCPTDAKSASGMLPAVNPVLKISAKNPGAWGNDLNIRISPASKAKTQILEKIKLPNGEAWRIKKNSGFQVGDIVSVSDGTNTIYNQVVKCQDNVLEFAEPFNDDVIDTKLVPVKILSTCEFNMEVQYNDINEVYENISLNLNAPNYIEKATAKSDLIQTEVLSTSVSQTANTSAPKPASASSVLEEEEEETSTSSITSISSTSTAKSSVIAPFNALAGNAEAAVVSAAMSGGSDGTAEELTATEYIGTDNGAGNRTGIQAFLDNSVVSVMAVPGITEPNVQMTLIAHCENLTSRFAILDLPEDCTKVTDITTIRNMFDSEYAAVYHPWLEVNDPLDKKNIFIPPSGSVAGIYARSDNTNGVQKAPANEVVRACVGLRTPYNKGEQDILNPMGVNLIRAFPGQGIRVWGARTLSSDPQWKYVNVRRLFIYIEETIRANTNWVVFESNTPALWARVRSTIEGFLLTLWSNGALAGSSAGEAFFCEIGPSTMTQDDIDNGRLICTIGVAPVKPAEFVIFRITQKTSEA